MPPVLCVKISRKLGLPLATRRRLRLAVTFMNDVENYKRHDAKQSYESVGPLCKYNEESDCAYAQIG